MLISIVALNRRAVLFVAILLSFTVCTVAVWQISAQKVGDSSVSEKTGEAPATPWSVRYPWSAGGTRAARSSKKWSDDSWLGGSPPANANCSGAIVLPGSGPFPFLTSPVDVTNAGF